MPIFTELNIVTARLYADALAACFETTVIGLTDIRGCGTVYEYAFADGTSAAVWFECGRVYGEA